MMYVYLNGDIVSQADAKISPFDHGYMYGIGLFETMRVYDGHPFLFDDHLVRLQQGLKTLNIQLSMTKEDLLDALYRLLEANNVRDAYVRLNVSAGEGPIGLQVAPYEKPTVMMYMKPLPKTTVFSSKEGTILSTRRNTPEGERRLKSHHYLNNVFGKREIGASKEQEGIFLTEQGYVAEGVVSNLFWYKDGTIYTPSLKTGILDGVTRRFVITLLDYLDVPYETGLFSVHHLLSADEVMLTNAVQEVVPFTAIGDHRFVGTSGSLTKRLNECYNHYKYTLWTYRSLI